MGTRANSLADRIEQGARALGDFAATLSDQEWRTPILPDGRTAGVIIHHVGNMYPLEIDLAGKLAAGQPIAGVTWAAVADVNAKHALEHAGATLEQALALLRENSRAAADWVRRLSDDELDRAAAVSLNGDAPLTTQFFIEDHALRHSFHHLAKIKATLKK